MGKLIVVLLGALVTAGVTYVYITGSRGTRESPKEKLENVQRAADRIEADQAERIEKALDKANAAGE